MKDFVGAKLELGDIVAISEGGSSFLALGKVKSFTPKMVTIEIVMAPAKSSNRSITKVSEVISRFPTQIVKVHLDVGDEATPIEWLKALYS